MWQFWLIVSGIFFIAEMITVGFLVFWFGIGALFAMLVSIFTDNIIIQTAVFILSSTVLLFLTRPFAEKITRKDKLKTNAYSIISKTGVVTVQINPTKGVGQIRLGSEVWTAKSVDESIIEVGTPVEVVSISGVKAIVKPIEERIEATIN